MQANKV